MPFKKLAGGPLSVKVGCDPVEPSFPISIITIFNMEGVLIKRSRNLRICFINA